MEDLRIAPVALRQNVDHDAKIMSGLAATIKSHCTSEQNVQKVRNKMAQDLKNLSAIEGNQNLKALYNDLAGGFTEINNAQTKYTGRLQSTVIPALAGFPNRTKDLKSSLKEYEAKRKAIDKQQNANMKALDSDPGKRALEKLEGEYKIVCNSLMGRLKAYEHGRTSEFKHVLLHTINAEMYYHAKALEKLSELAHMVHNIDDKKEAELMLSQKIYVRGGQPQGQSQQRQPPSQSQSGIRSPQEIKNQLQSQMGISNAPPRSNNNLSQNQLEGERRLSQSSQASVAQSQVQGQEKPERTSQSKFYPGGNQAASQIKQNENVNISQTQSQVVKQGAENAQNQSQSQLRQAESAVKSQSQSMTQSPNKAAANAQNQSQQAIKQVDNTKAQGQNTADGIQDKLKQQQAAGQQNAAGASVLSLFKGREGSQSSTPKQQ